MHREPLFEPPPQLVHDAYRGDARAVAHLGARYVEPLVIELAHRLAHRAGVDASTRDRAAAVVRDTSLVHIRYRLGLAFAGLENYVTDGWTGFAAKSYRMVLAEFSGQLAPQGDSAAVRNYVLKGVDPVRDMLPPPVINALAEVDVLGVAAEVYALSIYGSAGHADMLRLHVMLAAARLRLRLRAR